MAMALLPAMLLILSLQTVQLAASAAPVDAGDCSDGVCEVAEPPSEPSLPKYRRQEKDHVLLQFGGRLESNSSELSAGGELGLGADLDGHIQGEPCQESQIQRRRRAEGMCSCRRRSSSADLPEGMSCQGDAILPCGDRCPQVVVSGRQVLVGGQPFHMKGVNWGAVGKGESRNDFTRFVDPDRELMQNAGINVVRTYGPLRDTAILDKLWASGIWVMPTVYYSGGQSVDSVEKEVLAVKDHPSILMWVIGNEWNYNGLYTDMSKWDCINRIGEVARLIKRYDDRGHPVSTIYGWLPDSGTLAALPDIDVWGLNVYSGRSFGNLFNSWAGRSSKPMYLGEYGADAYNSNRRRGFEDQRSQADATRWLTEEIVARSSVKHDGVCLGGLLFELADEWWKDGSGSSSEHDNRGIAPGAGPHPDMTFNEEWWGIVDIDRNPREAYDAYRRVSNPMQTLPPPATTTTVAPDPSLCQASETRRRRRVLDKCSCRRRSGTADLEKGWACQGDSVTWCGDDCVEEIAQ